MQNLSVATLNQMVRVGWQARTCDYFGIMNAQIGAKTLVQFELTLYKNGLSL